MISLNQTTYSNEEIKLLLKTLYDEKKKNKDLILKLQQVETSKPLPIKSQEQEELAEENKALQLQVAALKKQIEKLQHETPKIDPRHIDLLQDSLERQNALERELRDLRERMAQSQSAPADDSLDEIRQLQDLVALLQEQLGKSKEKDEESNRLKQAYAQASREIKELSMLYQNVSKEKNDALLKAHQYLNQFESQKQEMARLQSTILRERQQRESLQKDLELLKIEKGKSEELQNELSKERQRIDALNNELALERHMRRDMEEELNRAQHHLAKKVKETALLEQNHEETKQSWMEAQKTLTENKMKINELQTAIELHRQQEIRLQNQLQEASKAAETQMARADEKYQLLSQKEQQAEKRIKELEKIEEKQGKLQSILSEISQLYGSTNPSEKPEKQIKSELPQSSIKEEKDKHFTDLFQIQKQPQKHRRSLLE